MTRWGIAGTGAMAEAFLADLAITPGHRAVAVGSRDRGRAAELAVAHDVEQGLTYADLVRADVDVVYVATPHPQHRDLALAAIGAGRPVLVEKAFAATLGGAREVVAAARRADVFCMEAMWTRVLPAVRRAHEVVDAGEIGELIAVQADLGAFRAYDESSRLFDPARGGGALLDLGVYVVSIAQDFLGTPTTVTARGTTYPNGTDASAALFLEYAEGRSASLWCSLLAQTPGRAVVVGTAGSVEIAPRFHHPDTIVVRRNGQDPETMTLPSPGAGYTHEILEVGRCLDAGLTESPLVPLEDTVAVQWVLQQALEQLGSTPHEGTVDL